MAESPNKRAKDIISFKILSGGSPIKDTYQVTKISVDYKLNVIPSATINLIDGDVAERDFPAANSKDFIPGTEIEIQAGYHGDDETIFKGIVVNMRISLDSDEGSILEITCRDKAILMTQARKSAIYSNQKDSDIISKLIGNHSGLSADVTATTYTHKELVQYDATDWDFMMVRADINGLVASINQGKISINKPDVSSSPFLSITYGDDIREFSAELNAVDQTPSVKASSWDAASQKIIDASSSEPTTSKIGNLTGKAIGTALSVDEEDLVSSAQVETAFLQTWADAKLLKTRLASLTGSATFMGSALAKTNSIIEINGVGDRFSGEAFISAVSHLINDGIWTTEIHFGLEDEWFASKPNVNPLPASGLTPQIAGLMIGIVKKLDEDPDGQNRVQVTLPMVGDDTNAIWARLSSYYATNKQGNFFIPEIGNEVVLGFLNNDPNYPVILGSLYSSKNPPPYKLTADNYTKAIVTKSECKIEFDDEKKIITIQTPGENKIVISDEDKSIKISDQNKNVIEMSADGIKIDSCKDVTISAKANIKMTATQNIESKSTADTTIKGMNITGTADVGITMKGNATAEFSASGQTTVKGAMVMIN